MGTSFHTIFGKCPRLSPHCQLFHDFLDLIIVCIVLKCHGRFNIAFEKYSWVSSPPTILLQSWYFWRLQVTGVDYRKQRREEGGNSSSWVIIWVIICRLYIYIYPGVYSSDIYAFVCLPCPSIYCTKPSSPPKTFQD